MEEHVFKEFLDLLMVLDPWPKELSKESEQLLKTWADSEAIGKGYTNWIDAYHDVKE